MARARKTQRTAETRTKIQLGGLVIKATLAQGLGIAPGEDVQQQRRDEAAILLGGLLHLVCLLNGQHSESWKRKFYAEGSAAMLQPTPKPGKPEP